MYNNYYSINNFFFLDVNSSSPQQGNFEIKKKTFVSFGVEIKV